MCSLSLFLFVEASSRSICRLIYRNMEINCVWNKKSSTRLGGPSFDFLFSVEIWFFYRKIFLLHREYILARFSKFVVSLSSIFLYLYTSLYLARADLNWLLIEITSVIFLSFLFNFSSFVSSRSEVKFSMDKMEKSVQSVRDLILKWYIDTIHQRHCKTWIQIIIETISLIFQIAKFPKSNRILLSFSNNFYSKLDENKDCNSSRKWSSIKQLNGGGGSRLNDKSMINKIEKRWKRAVEGLEYFGYKSIRHAGI